MQSSKRNESRLIAHVLFLSFIAGSWIAFGQVPNPEGVQPTNALLRMPIPSGPFGIGRVGYDWADPSRPDRYSTEPNAHRELMVYFWYPTSAKSAETKGPYLPGARRMDTLPEIQGRMRREFGSLSCMAPASVSGGLLPDAGATSRLRYPR